MIRSKKCPKCGDNRIAGPHNVHGGDGTHIKIDLPGFSTATLLALTCADCGYTEFYSDRIGLDNIRSSGRFVIQTRPIRPSKCSVCGAPATGKESYCKECGSLIS
jgi:predicted nucleic-acid-binding Zn-ribbon protein